MTIDQFVKLAAIKSSGAASPKLSVRKKRDGKYWITGGEEPQGPYDTKQEAQADKDGIVNFFKETGATPEEAEPDLAEADLVKKVGRGKGSLDVVQTADGLYFVEGSNGNYGPYKTVDEAVEQAKYLRSANGKSPKPNLKLIAKPDTATKKAKSETVAKRKPVAAANDMWDQYGITVTEMARGFRIQFFHEFPVVSILRWMGAEGWEPKQCRHALIDTLQLPVSNSTINIQQRNGRIGEGEPAGVNKSQAKLLAALLK